MEQDMDGIRGEILRVTSAQTRVSFLTEVLDCTVHTVGALHQESSLAEYFL